MTEETICEFSKSDEMVRWAGIILGAAAGTLTLGVVVALIALDPQSAQNFSMGVGIAVTFGAPIGILSACAMKCVASPSSFFKPAKKDEDSIYIVESDGPAHSISDSDHSFTV